MLFAEEDGNLYNAETLCHIGAIRLLLRLSCIMKFNLYQMDVKSALLNRYLNVKVSQNVSNVFINMDGIIEKDDYMEVSMEDAFDFTTWRMSMWKTMRI